MIDLARGHPSTRLFPVERFQKATQTFLEKLASGQWDGSTQLSDESLVRERDRHPMQYGADLGSHDLRASILEWERSRGISRNLHPDMLGVTCGASYGLMNAVTQFAEQGYTSRIFMITPAYFLAARIFIDAGFEDCLTAIDEVNNLDDGLVGPDLKQLTAYVEGDAARSKSEATLAGKRFKYIFYGVPNFSNPSGITWTESTRKDLVRLAQKHDMLIITDEVYEGLSCSTVKNEHVNTSEVHSRMVDLDLASKKTTGFGNCIGNRSFSKYLGPGLRVGYVACSSTQMAAQFSAGGANHSGGATSQLTSYIVRELVREGDDSRQSTYPIVEILAELQEVYALRRDAMLEVLFASLPKGSLVNGHDAASIALAPQGGYFLWVTLPQHSHIDLPDVLSRLRDEKGVLVMPGLGFEVKSSGPESRGWASRCFRLSFSWEEADKCVKGVKKLCQAIDEAWMHKHETAEQ
ncbi:pyridoxal phosphate-dependent transferase [Protomyces lactucae-debilis]|uniref:Pyridoxal phosphate-dependent transferase n=1 Tax=Protomyces lactucae-debilis TaxID=2754530 RepID=A0A1Y2FQB4_PROLT|nr:pyridoxal phosphate-dependent transferase [Protomyces lactucae-debilis]ORY86183.1 pyridoxal phosphate-dependent transferase [Protomyces lactucae-debilis]